MTSPTEIVNRQLQAYNERDIDTYCSLFALDAVVVRLNGNHVLARGIGAIRQYYLERFESRSLFCRIRSRIELGEFVVDHEEVTGIGERALEVIAIYEVRDSVIQSVQILWPSDG
jgi:hypothetical protein